MNTIIEQNNCTIHTNTFHCISHSETTLQCHSLGKEKHFKKQILILFIVLKSDLNSLKNKKYNMTSSS